MVHRSNSIRDIISLDFYRGLLGSRYTFMFGNISRDTSLAINDNVGKRIDLFPIVSDLRSYSIIYYMQFILEQDNYH